MNALYLLLLLSQVAVHNVPFKWCNHDLESLFAAEPGYLDAQLLFHDNGRSKVGAGVTSAWGRPVEARAMHTSVC